MKGIKVAWRVNQLGCRNFKLFTRRANEPQLLFVHIPQLQHINPEEPLYPLSSPPFLPLSPPPFHTFHLAYYYIHRQHHHHQQQRRFQEMGYMGTTTFATLLVFTALLFSATPSTAQNFKCTTSANCTSLVGYVSPNRTTIGHIQTFFNVKNLRKILGANNLPLSTPSNYTIQANQTIRIPVSCHCTNNTGVVRSMPVYTVVAGDGLYNIATFVFGGLVKFPKIQEVNNISDANLIEVGQNLSIPLPCSCDDVKGQKVVHYDHVVQPESSLEEIALKFGTDKETLMELNGITNEKSLLAYEPLDVPLRACNSSIRSNSIDSGLHIANDTYVFTASDCVKCQCDAANDWTLKCEPSGLQLPSNQTCPPMTCQGASLVLGNVSSDGCSTCAYEGYLNQTTILTNVVQLSTCPISDNNNAAPRMSGNWNCLFISIHLVLLYLYLSQ